MNELAETHEKLANSNKYNEKHLKSIEVLNGEMETLKSTIKDAEKDLKQANADMKKNEKSSLKTIGDLESKIETLDKQLRRQKEAMGTSGDALNKSIEELKEKLSVQKIAGQKALKVAEDSFEAKMKTARGDFEEKILEGDIKMQKLLGEKEDERKKHVEVFEKKLKDEKVSVRER